MKNLLITNAKVATSQSVFEGAVLVKSERIEQVFATPYPDTGALQVEQKIDAEGKYLLPGGVDAHTHFDLDTGSFRACDDFHTGSIAAACGGTTTVIDHMAFGPPGCALTHQPKVYHDLAKPCVIDYGFHGTIQHVDAQILSDMAVLQGDGICSFKIYLTYAYKLCDADILSVFERAKQLGAVVCVHCENDATISHLSQKFVSQGKTQPRYHAQSRTPQAEAEGIFRILMLADIVGDVPLYIVHLSTELGLQAVDFARRNGIKNVIVESCPQYFLLDDTLYEEDIEGLKYILSPPLRKKADMDALWQALANGQIDTIGTDHCPFTTEQKTAGAHNFTLCPNGISGVELRLALMFSHGFMAGRITLPQLVQTLCTNPARIFGIAPQKGDITEGADADLVLFDPDVRRAVTHGELHENVDYTPYEGIQLCGRPTLTISRGEIIVRDGVFLGNKGRGRYLHRCRG